MHDRQDQAPDLGTQINRRGFRGTGAGVLAVATAASLGASLPEQARLRQAPTEG
jgi:hypothetical protein